jgi:putative CocE/NonD family hydrolase
VFETGSNVWETYDTWPPAGTESAALYFHPNGRLSFEPPTDSSGDAYDEYVSDPAKPVPFSSEIRTTQGHEWMIEDQRFASTRPDVLVYQTEVLTEDVTLAGPILATLFASTSGTDSDWIVKLIDVYPGDAVGKACPVPMSDFQMLLAGEVFRGKFRNSYTTPEPMVSGEITELEFSLRDRYHTFKAGHRIMVQVQSTWFPVIDRNPQTFVDIYKATASDFQASTQRIYRSSERASHLTVGLLPGHE